MVRPLEVSMAASSPGINAPTRGLGNPSRGDCVEGKEAWGD